MALGATLSLCAEAYRRFCQRYKPKPKPERHRYWGSNLLARMKIKGKPKKKTSPGQTSLWQEWDTPIEKIQAVAEKFVVENALNPGFVRCQVTN